MNLKISISKVIELLEKEKLIKNICIYDENLEMEYLSFDSRDIQKNTLFFCKGKLYKVEYLEAALNNGAVCYISEEEYEQYMGHSHIVVTDVRKAMAVIAKEFYDNVSDKLNTIGITGTKGKTTVTYFLNDILNSDEKFKTAMISTAEVITGKRSEESHLTTPEALDLHKYFYEAKESNLNNLVMEVTSQSYKVDRVYGVDFAYGMFLNISEDHISDSEHTDFEDYFSCKLALIKHIKNTIVINNDMSYIQRVLGEAEKYNKKVVTYGDNNSADYYYTNVVKEEDGFSFDIVCEKENYVGNFKITMQGRFNVENATAAIVMAKVLGVSDDIIRKGILNTVVLGRMNIYEKNGIVVVVDYAHNLLSFTKLYESIKLDYPGRRIISVGGAPGGKAYKRRQDFGEVVGKNSDYIYLTAEDPQFEDVKQICLDIISFIPEGAKYEIVEDRKEAVEKAIRNAKEGDVVVLLAKSEEEYQKVRGVFTYYESDLKIAKRILAIP